MCREAPRSNDLLTVSGVAHPESDFGQVYLGTYLSVIPDRHSQVTKLSLRPVPTRPPSCEDKKKGKKRHIIIEIIISYCNIGDESTWDSWVKQMGIKMTLVFAILSPGDPAPNLAKKSRNASSKVLPVSTKV